MTQTTINGKKYTVANIEAIDGALGADMQKRGFEAAFYTLTGPRGGAIVCWKSAKTGEFSKL
jgi:hypothetical protein